MKKKKDDKNLNNNDLKPRKWILYLLIVINIVIIVILINKVVTDRKDKTVDRNSIFDNFFEKLEDMNTDNDFEKKSFNSSFEMYVGTEWGLSVSRLIDEINTNNKTNPDRLITVVFGNISTTDVDEIRNIKKSLGDWTEYEVVLDYDSDGFVNQITIEN